MAWIMSGDNAADAITGERINPQEMVFDTGVLNKDYPFNFSRNRVVKEATIVWLAEQAGFSIVRGDAGDSGDSEVVDGADVRVGGGEDPVGEVAVGGGKSSKRRSGGKASG